ncbi:MAG: hypothetical protein CW338_08695 [Clostridiales bacterium]|nr:hypothetical protein [Clostridiales bacterium]
MGLLSRLFSSGEDIRSILITLCLYIPAMLLALILHECAHALAAHWSGDETARDAGRISLNPLDHLSLSGTLCMLFIGIGWAKPVPVDSRNMRNPRKNMIWVSLAGILTNFSLFLISTFFIVILCKLALPSAFISSVDRVYTNVGNGYYDYVNANGNCFWMLYSGKLDVLINDVSEWYRTYPFYRYDLTIQYPALLYVIRFFMIFGIMNLSLAVFNFLPVPPLDGYNFWNLVLFKGRMRISRSAMIVILIIFYALMLFGDRIFGFSPLSKAIYIIQGAFADLFLSIF